MDYYGLYFKLLIVIFDTVVKATYGNVTVTEINPQKAHENTIWILNVSRSNTGNLNRNNSIMDDITQKIPKTRFALTNYTEEREFTWEGNHIEATKPNGYDLNTTNYQDFLHLQNKLLQMFLLTKFQKLHSKKFDPHRNFVKKLRTKRDSSKSYINKSATIQFLESFEKFKNILASLLKNSSNSNFAKHVINPDEILNEFNQFNEKLAKNINSSSSTNGELIIDDMLEMLNSLSSLKKIADELNSQLETRFKSSLNKGDSIYNIIGETYDCIMKVVSCIVNFIGDFFINKKPFPIPLLR